MKIAFHPFGRLIGTAFSRHHDMAAHCVGDRQRLVARAAIGHHDLLHQAAQRGADQRIEAARQGALRIEGRDHHAYHGETMTRRGGSTKLSRRAGNAA